MHVYGVHVYVIVAPFASCTEDAQVTEAPEELEPLMTQAEQPIPQPQGAQITSTLSKTAFKDPCKSSLKLRSVKTYIPTYRHT